MQGIGNFSGGQSDRVTPGPMPNPEVKPVSADGTMRGTHGRAGRRQYFFYKRCNIECSSILHRYFYAIMLKSGTHISAS